MNANWTAEKEKEYQRKIYFEKHEKCLLCGKGLWYGHILKYKEGYAHRRCITQLAK